jgi:Domain of unknown function (DUF4371)/hAT family C-terminal dimerisation region
LNFVVISRHLITIYFVQQETGNTLNLYNIINMSYKYKSGAQKRREHDAKVANASEGVRKLSAFGFSTTPVAVAQRHSTEDECSTHSLIVDNDNDNNDDVIINITSTSPSARAVVEETNATASQASSNDQHHQHVIQCDDAANPLQPQLQSSSDTFASPMSCDVGEIDNVPTPQQIELLVKLGHTSPPNPLPPDCTGYIIPNSIFTMKKQNGEKCQRCWLVFSNKQQSFFCLPCRLFAGKLNELSSSALSSSTGWGIQKKWKKLWDRVPQHERSNVHKKCFIAWRELERRMQVNSSVNMLMESEIQSESTKWKKLLERLIDVTLFLGERGLAFRGSSQQMYDPSNGNFLGILELIAHYDPILQEHVTKVSESQKRDHRLQFHYLSSDSQNEFIHLCAEQVRNAILMERERAKYFAIMVDATPDSSHVEQTTFILRYLSRNVDITSSVTANANSNSTFTDANIAGYTIKERFWKFVNCNDKTGQQIAEMILNTMKESKIPFDDCRAQAYDNGANMAGAYNGAQSHILDSNPLCLFSPCGCHSLNLCGVDAAACSKEATTFFGVVQTVYNLFSCSPARWEMLTKNIGSSLHTLSDTRWTARVASVRPFAAHLPGIENALQQLLTLNLTPKTRYEIMGVIKYVNSFECVVMAAVWLKVLVSIDYRNQVIQARDTTIDVEVNNLRSLLADLIDLRNNQWTSILAESKNVASAMGIPAEFAARRPVKRRRFADENSSTTGHSSNQTFETTQTQTTYDSAENAFKQNVFNVIFDSVISGLTRRFNAAHEINTLFSFLWQYLQRTEAELQDQCRSFADKYHSDVSATDLIEEVLHLKTIHESNFGSEPLSPVMLLNKLASFNLEAVFCNIVTALRIFCTIPVTVASAERSFSKLTRIKNFQRSTMLQCRLTDLGTLSIESELAREVSFAKVIETFALQKARKAFLK